MADYLIIGAGYLAGFLIEQCEAPRRIITVARSNRDRGSPGCPGGAHIACDVATTAGLARLRSELDGFGGTVFVLLPPSAYAAERPDESARMLAEVLAGRGAERVVVASSTGVYEGVDTPDIDLQTRPVGSSARARRLLAIEDAWLRSEIPCQVMRFAGLYGPGRIIGQRAVRVGDSLPGTGEEWLNLIDIRDAARAFIRLAAMGVPGQTMLISDGTPLPRKVYYGRIAELLHAPTPRFDPRNTRRGGSRRCNPAAAWAALELSPHHPDARDNLASLLKTSDA